MARSETEAAKETEALSGPVLKLESYYIEDTWACLLVGIVRSHDATDNARRRLQDIWGGGRPYLMVQPPAKLSGLRTCMAWVTGPAVGGYDGTHLFVIWFQHTDPVDPLKKATQLIEEHGGWDALAKGWAY